MVRIVDKLGLVRALMVVAVKIGEEESDEHALQRVVEVVAATINAVVLDAGNEGERVITRVRIALVAVLLLVPLTNLQLAAITARPQHLAGLFVTLGAFVPSAGIYYMVQRDRRQR